MDFRLRPRADAALIHEDANVRVYADGTWEPLAHGHWAESDDAQIWANGTGPARLRTTTGRRKQSKATAPDGTVYDFWALALANSIGGTP